MSNVDSSESIEAIEAELSKFDAKPMNITRVLTRTRKLTTIDIIRIGCMVVHGV